ncbi:hypothetical protein QU38_02825, partial [Staphylococcus aureus]
MDCFASLAMTEERAVSTTPSLLLRPLDAFEDQFAGFVGVAPAQHLHPLALLEILVVLEEVLDLLEHDRRQVLPLADVRIIGEGAVHRHADQLLVAAGLVLELEHADRAGTHHAARHEGRARDDQRVERVAVGRERVRHEAVIRRVAHRRVQDAVDEQGAAGLVELILHRLAADGNLDDHVEAVRRIVTH